MKEGEELSLRRTEIKKQRLAGSQKSGSPKSTIDENQTSEEVINNRSGEKGKEVPTKNKVRKDCDL